MLLLFITAIGLLMALPLFFAISSSLKPLSELWLFPPRLFVINPTLKNYRSLFSLMNDSWVPFSKYIFNTVLYSVLGTAGNVVFSSMCAYAISKIKYRGSRVIFQAIVYSLMFSTAVTAIPNFLIIKSLGLLDTLWAVVLPSMAAPLGLYLMKQFMETLVHDVLLEAARIDGANEWTLFWKIVMPMVKPAWLTLIVFSFQSLWNMGQNFLIRRETLKTFNYAVSQIISGGIARAGAGSAAAVLLMIVPVTVFIFTQSSIVETMSTSGMKD